MSKTRLPIEDELQLLQSETFEYFLQETNPANGLVIDKTEPNWPSSIAATGFALLCYIIAVERGFMSRTAAIERTLTTMRFFWNSPQGPEADATGYKGFYYHFLDMKTGRRVWDCELSTVDTTFLIAGMLAAATYFKGDNAEEQEIRTLADALYRRVDWQWALNKGDTVDQGWTPESGFFGFRWDGYDEALLLYILGLASPTFPLPESCYAAWTASYKWENNFGHEYLYAGSLFTHQLSHMWIDFREIQDPYMQEKGIDYFENSRRATYVQQAYSIQNPLKFVGYGENSWGLTACDGPGPNVRKVDGVDRQFYDYVARGVPYGPDDGTISPWVTIASLPFTPEIVIPALNYFIYDLKLKEGPCYSFRASYNQTYPEKNHACGWISPWEYGLNLAPIMIMIENYRTELLWKLMRDCPYIVNGLRRAGFKGGWLSTVK
jgi:hypothetical protein